MDPIPLSDADGDALWRLSQVLRALDPAASFDDLRDALWLAGHLPRHGAPRAAEPAPQRVPGPEDRRPPASGGAGDSPATTEARAHQAMQTIAVDDDAAQPPAQALYASGPAAVGGIAARRVRLPAPHPLPDALAIGRALLPVTRRRPHGAFTVLDEEATAEAIAHTGLATPVMRQRRERWFDVVLAVDAAPSMIAWRSRIDELEALLLRAGFRDVRRATLSGAAATGGMPHLAMPDGSLLASGQDAAALRDAGRLLLVVSDAAGAAWHDGRVSTLLAPWSRVMPVALVQALPPRLWPHTATGFAELAVAASAPAQAVTELAQARPEWARGEPGLVLPVVALDKASVGEWARMVMASGEAWCRAALLPAAAGDASGVLDAGTGPGPASGPEAAALLRGFVAAAAPEALELAAAFAVIRPLNLPVMQLIQAVMLPAAGQEALAQVLMSGLLQRQDADAQVPAFEIDDAMRDELAGYLTRSRWLEVNLAVQRFVEAESGVGFDFMALIEDRLGAEQVPPSAMPFARLALRMAGRFLPDRAAPGRGRTVRERVFSRGLTLQDEAEVPAPIERLAWSPSGRELAVMHALGADRFARRPLQRRARERPVAQLIRWVVPRGEAWRFDLLRERLLDSAESTHGRPFTDELVEDGAPRPVVSASAALTLFVSTDVPVDMYRSPWLSAATVAVPLLTMRSTRAQPLRDPSLAGWLGVFDRPVDSMATMAAFGALWLNARMAAPEFAQASFRGPDAIAWRREDGQDVLMTVYRQAGSSGVRHLLHASGSSRNLVAPEGGAELFVDDFSPVTGAYCWKAAEPSPGLVAWADPSRRFEYDRMVSARFSPDGRAVAMVDAKGRLQVVQEPSQ